MALYVEGIDRDKISDLTTNVIRKLLVTYTQQQCELHDVPTRFYSGPPVWDIERLNWISMHVKLPFIGDNATMLVPKYIVRRKLSLDSQEFYNKQITDFLVAETLRANTSLVRTIKGRKKVLKTEVRQEYPKDKQFIADLVFKHPELLSTYKEIARAHKSLTVFRDDFDQVTVTTACANLATLFSQISPGTEDADKYHNLILGSFTALFYPNLIQPHKEWEIHGRRKRIDVVFANAADSGFFAHRRNDPLTHANTVIVECKNYSSDLANPELDQLIGRFDNNRGKFGIIACRSIDNPELLLERVRDAASRSQGYIIVLTDEDIIAMLSAKASLKDDEIEALLFRKFRDLVA
jgi:hypothetical protein